MKAMKIVGAVPDGEGLEHLKGVSVPLRLSGLLGP